MKRRTERLTCCCCGGSELEARTRAREDGGTRRRGVAAEAERGRSPAVAVWGGCEWWSGGARARSGMVISDLVLILCKTVNSVKKLD